MGRRQTREAAVKILFQFEFQKDSREEQLEYFLNDEEQMKSVEKDYLGDVVRGVCENTDMLNSLISDNMKESWSLERIAKIDLCILRVCLYEYKITGEIPLKIAANEAVELAKKYGDDSSPGFVNGLLGGV